MMAELLDVRLAERLVLTLVVPKVDPTVEYLADWMVVPTAV